MKRINNFINSIQEDKKAHLIIGVLTGFPMVILFGNIGGLIAIIIYGLKELIHYKLQVKVLKHLVIYNI